MKKFASYTVEFEGCTHILNFDFCIGYDVVSDYEIVVHAWFSDDDEMLEGEFVIKGLQGSFNHTSDYIDLIRFLLNQYCL